ncbi:MAG TPA: PD-(D/E)XK nuclease family protein, partial [Prosthecobacter sp.]|nr:PD-(D/E)XK nuclease family protein [Prosthecobacter sp.]
MPPPPPLHRLFWGWDVPVLDRAVAWLTQDWQPASGAVDLSDTLIIVPTAEAARRLKEALAKETAKQDQGVSIPWVWTPEQALLPSQPRLATAPASKLQALIAWQQALRNAPLPTLRDLFPTLPDDRGWTWHIEMARLMADLKSLLGAGGHTFAELPLILSHDVARWRDLAELEKAYLAVLAQAGLQDAQALKRQIASAPVLPAGLRRVLILAAPDLPPLFDRWVQSCGLPVTIAIQAPANLSHLFDAIGRPLPSAWGEDADQTVPISDSAIHIRHDASHQAATAVDLIRNLAPLGHVALGVADPEVGAMLEEKLTLEQVQVFQPGGVAVQEVGLWHVLGTLRTMLAGGSWRAFATLLRVPEVRRALALSAEHGLDLVALADELSADHLPVTIAHASELLERMADLRHQRRPDKPRMTPAMELLGVALREAETLMREVKRQPLSQAARTLLVRLYGEREFAPDAPGDQLTTELGGRWLQLAAEVETETARFGLNPRAEDALDLSLEALAQERLAEPRGDVDLVLQGWLELLWERAPNLVVAGMNEEFVPGISISHPFLPDRLRQELGLPCQATRFARDACLLRALAEQRLANGRLEILCGQWSESGDALRPSRLLFLCADQELPRRVSHLFPKDAHGSADPEPPRTIAWKLRPQVIPPAVTTISPSRIRSYLECCFRDYLSNELQMEAVEPRKRELAVNEFGSLAHHAFQCLAEDAAMRRSTSVKDIEEFLIEAAHTRGRALYGARWAPLVSLQFESLKQRLRHAAQCEAEERERGWQILRAEWQLGGPEDDKPLLIEGARLRCTVDRIERHEGTGQIRVLDFKTSDKARDPRAEHAAKITSRKRLPPEDEWKCFDHSSGVRLQWKDLQLPLYAAALRLHGHTPDIVGYFAVPKSVQDTRLMTWDDF